MIGIGKTFSSIKLENLLMGFPGIRVEETVLD